MAGELGPNHCSHGAQNDDERATSKRKQTAALLAQRVKAGKVAEVTARHQLNSRYPRSDALLDKYLAM